MLSQQWMNDKWWEIKGGLRNIWGQLSEEEIDAHKGNLEAIAGVIHRKFGENRDSIKSKMDSLMGSFDNETDKSDFYQSSFERSPLGPDQGATSDIAHTNYHVRHDGLAEEAENRGVEYSANEVGNKNTRDFDSDRNARH